MADRADSMVELPRNRSSSVPAVKGQGYGVSKWRLASIGRGQGATPISGICNCVANACNSNSACER